MNERLPGSSDDPRLGGPGADHNKDQGSRIGLGTGPQQTSGGAPHNGGAKPIGDDPVFAHVAYALFALAPFTGLFSLLCGIALVWWLRPKVTGGVLASHYLWLMLTARLLGAVLVAMLALGAVSLMLLATIVGIPISVFIWFALAALAIPVALVLYYRVARGWWDLLHGEPVDNLDSLV